MNFPTWGSGKKTENLQGICLWRPVGFDYRTYTGLGKQTFGGHRQNLVHTRTQEEGAETLQEIDPDLPVTVQESLAQTWVCSSLLQGQGNWGQKYMHRMFWRRSPLSSLPPPWFGLRLNSREGHNPAHQQKIGLKIYRACPCPSEQDPVCPRVSSSHLEASIGLLPLSFRGLTEWKHNHRKLIKLITWITALSNSIKLRANHVGAPKMNGPWRRVLTKCGPLEDGMANHFSILSLKTHEQYEKAKI